MSDTQGEQKPSPVAPGDPKSSSVVAQLREQLPQILWGLVVAVIFLWAVVSNFDIPEQHKMRIMVGFGAVVVFLTAIGLLFYFHKNRTVAWATNFMALLLATSVLALVPIVFRQGEQVLLLKIGAAVFLSLLPSWLYLQFIAVKGKALGDEYVLNLYRLKADDYCNLPEPAPDSVYHERWQKCHKKDTDSQPTNLYMRKFDGLFGEALGSSAKNSSGRFQRENLFPVLFTTLLISVGWVVILQPEAVFGLPLLPTEPILSGVPALPGTALAYGFVGAYFFIIQMLIRRYFQDDLKTSAYINATARIVAVLLLVTVLHTIWPWTEQQEYAFAFLIGIFPQVGLQALQTLVTLPLRPLLPSLKKEYPLSDLDGLNIWYESRLLEEGIEDMQNLATSNLVDVMLRTRVPVDRLIDWVDQAHLYLRVRNDDGDKDQPSSRDKLRRLGIRTATDLKDAMAWPTDSRSEKQKSAAEVKAQKDLVNRLRWALNQNDNPDAPSVVDAILKSLENESNLYHVRAWRDYTDELKRRWEGMSAQVEKRVGSSE